MGTMHDPYVVELERAHRAEVFGEASYAVLARLAGGGERRAKLEALRRLETTTKQRLAGALGARGVRVRDSRAARLLGAAAAAVAPLPWRWEMRLLARILELTVPAFERFERRFGERDPSLAHHLAEHERAQLEFFRREAAGDPGALDAVNALIGRKAP